MANLWTQPNNYLLRTLNERIFIAPGELSLPLSTTTDVTVTLISGELPVGMRIAGTDLVGAPVEEVVETDYTFVLRATTPSTLEDRTLRLRVDGADQPRWVDDEGLLPIGPNNRLFILDNEIIDLELAVIDPDLPAGDTLEFYIAPGDGVLPPGITLTSDGRLTGVVEPLLALDKQASEGGYDTNPYDVYPNDYAIPSTSGFDSFDYDTVEYDFAFPSTRPNKLNRYYEFAVKVADKYSQPIRRVFQIYVVGDDFVTADNTIVKVSNGVFTADLTNIRTPRWITPPDLGALRADNYATIYLDTLVTNNLEGRVVYSLESQNPDGTDSVLPKGTALDSISGEVIGYIPGQPAVTIDYKFTVRATRFTTDDDIAVVTIQVYEDTFSGQKRFKVFKLPTGTSDGIDDLGDLRNRRIFIDNQQYTVSSIDGSNEDYDVITTTDTLKPKLTFTTAEVVPPGSTEFFINRLSYRDSIEWEGKRLNYSEQESYGVTRIQPYIEWQITSPSGSIAINYAAAGINPPAGGNETLNSAIDRTFSTEEYDIEITSATASSVRIFIPKNKDAALARLRAIFGGVNTDLTFTVLDDTRSLLKLDSPLVSGRSFGLDRTIGISVFEDDVIKKEFLSDANQDITNPSSIRTFNVRVLGEIESELTWITPSDLGTINANFVSTLRVEAETTVPNGRIVYSVVSGNLPAGLRLSYRGAIIGSARQFASSEGPGLTRIDNQTTTFDEGETTIDREFKFTVRAADRFNFSASTREFTLRVDDLDSTLYNNIYVRPFMKPSLRNEYRNFVSDTTIFPSDAIYRPNDPAFGKQLEPKMLIYAGIESKATYIDDDGIEQTIDPLAWIAAAAAKNHKRRRYQVGDVKRAVAKRPGTNEAVYELIYLEVVDPAEPALGETKERFKINNTKRITSDSSGYDQKEAEYNSDFVNSEPRRQRNHPYNNTIKADSDAVIVNQEGDVLRYLSNTTNMRKRIEEIGKVQRDYLPLWMRTGQSNAFRELGYVTAIPIAYCKVGTSEDVLLNVQNALKNREFDLKELDLDVDRYLVDNAADSTDERYILFANYQFNE